jgi:hypothetical protein
MVIASPGLAFAARPSELSMSSEQILEAVSYIAWASGFLILGVGLALAVVSYRRWANSHDDHPPLPGR